MTSFIEPFNYTKYIFPSSLVADKGESGTNLLASIDLCFEALSDPSSGLGMYRGRSRLPEGMALGRIVCLGAGDVGAEGERWLDLAYGDPPPGEERRRVPFGVTVEAAPAQGEFIRVVTMGLAVLASDSTPTQTFYAGMETPVTVNITGKKLYLKDADPGDPDTQGLMTDDPSESTSETVCGHSLPNSKFLFRPDLG